MVIFKNYDDNMYYLYLSVYIIYSRLVYIGMAMPIMTD